jgi:hypothetical protein
VNDGDSYHFHQQLPVDANSSLLVLAAILTKPTAHLSHLLQAVTAVQQVLDVLGHYLRDVLEFIIQLVQVLCGTAVLVCLLGLLNEGVELDEGIWAARGRQVLLRWVGRGELLSKITEVGEGKLAWVAGVADGEEDDAVDDGVTVCRG